METQTKTAGKNATAGQTALEELHDSDRVYSGLLNRTDGQTSQNKCLFCGRVIGDYVSNYHVGCYRQKRLLEESEAQHEN